MSDVFGQSSTLEPLRPNEGAPGLNSAASSPLATGNADRALFRVDLKRSLQMHRRLAVGVAVVGAALAVAYFLSLWPVYSAQSLVYVQPSAPKVMDQGGPVRWPFDGGTYETYIAQQMQSVTRDDVLGNALHKLGPGTFQGASESDQAAIERLRRAIEVLRLGATYQFSIGARASSPATAAQLANAVTTSYIESASREQKAGNVQRLAMLREERDRIQNELNADRTEQAALNKQLGMAAIGKDTPNYFDEDIGRTRVELVKARTDHDEAAAKFTSMGAGHGPSSTAIDAEAESLVAADAGLASMKTALNQRRAALITQMANLTPNHPQYKQDTVELAQIDSTIDSMMKDLRAKAAVQIQEKLRTDLARAAGVETQMNGHLRQMVGAAGSATPKLQRSSDLVADITRLQTRFSTVDELLHNLLLEDAAPGAAFLTAAAVPPLHPAKSGVIRNAILLAFFAMLMGMTAAVAAHKLDPRVYIASDVEQVLGFAPMSQLPDFTEVSDGVAEEHLLRLSAVIEYARKQGDLKSCIFTGTGSGTGVTTVVTRVREMLEAMGRATVLVDASGTPLPVSRAGSGVTGRHDAQGQLVQRGSRSTALLQQLADESERQEESLVLTDTAPLVVSAESQYLARYVDCAIVIIESGVTTRAQLREVANTLQRLDVAAVGFVLNRVRMGTADPAFRHSVRDVERHLHAQSRSTARRTVRSRHSAAEASPDTRQYAPETARAQQEVAPAPATEVSASRTSTTVSERPIAPPEAASLPRRVLTMRPAQESIPPFANPDSDLPWWLADASPQADVPLPVAPSRLVKAREHEAAAVSQPSSSVLESQPQAPQIQPWERASSRLDDFRPETRLSSSAAEEGRQPETEETPNNAATRLSGLRNLLFSLGLKNMETTSESRVQGKETFPRFEPRTESPVYGRTYVQEPEPVLASPARSSFAGTSQRVVTAQPEFLPPKTYAEISDKESQAAVASTNRRDRRDAYDDVEILPSWRGQYRKKK